MRPLGAISALFMLGAFSAACGEDATSDAGVVDGATPQPDAAADGGVRADTGPADLGTADTGTMDTGVGPQARTFSASLSGGQEVPSVTTTATGSLMLTLETDGTLSYRLTHNVTGGSAAHLHLGIAGGNGPVVFPLTPFGAQITGTLTPTPAQVEAIEAGRYYVNVHSATHAGGEIRGQVLNPGERLYSATLQGIQEVPAVDSALTGYAQLVLSADGTNLHYQYVTNATVAAAHVHGGAAGVAGAVIFPLSARDGTQSVTAAQVSNLQQGLWYVNVHTAANPNGELRGQITTPGSTVWVATLSPGQEVPTNTATTSGSAMVVLNYTQTQARYWVSSNANATAAHVHSAPGGLSGGVEFPLSAPTDGVYRDMQAVTPAQVAQLQRGTLYVNIHTAAHAGGEIRGQLLRIGERLYTAVLSGDNETPPVVTQATGGFGLIIDRDGNARYDGAVTMVAPTAAHIHRGAAGAAGPVAYPLVFNGMTLSGEQVIAGESLAALPTGGLYVNVHSAANAGGEIRGQLEAK